MRLLRIKFWLIVTNSCVIGLVHAYLLYMQNNKWKWQTNMKFYCVSVNYVLVVDRMYDFYSKTPKTDCTMSSPSSPACTFKIAQLLS